MRAAVGFDFDHTLGIDNKLERTVVLDMLSAMTERRGVPFDRVAATPRVDEAIAAFRRGDVPVETALEGLFMHFAGPDPDNLAEAGRFRDEAVARAPEFVRALPGVPEMLAALDGLEIRYALLTNGWSPLQEEKARLIGFKAPVFVSERIGYSKPARDAFETLARNFELPPEDVWYVGDDPRADCAGARAAGMTAVWFDWEGHAYPADLAQPNHVIRAPEELPPLLAAQLAGAAKPAQ